MTTKSIWRYGLAFLVAACLMLGLAPLGHADPTPSDPVLKVTIQRTDDLGDDVHVGDTLRFTIGYTNTSSQNVTAFPRTSNLSGVLTDGTPNCRWGNLPPNSPKQCTTAYHVVTDEDVANGFTPTVTFDATRDRNGNQVVQAGTPVTTPAIPVKAGPRPHPSEVTEEITDGVARRLAEQGLAGFNCHRIPALTQANDGTLIAAWDGRPGNCADAPQANSIIGRLSHDGGKTWSQPITIAAGQTSPAAQKYGYSDPSFVTDRETGEIFAFFVKSFDRGIRDSQAGVDPDNRNVLHAAVTSSTDNGRTWSEPRVITADITNDAAAETGRFAASGEGIQLRYGEHKGRLLQPFTMNYGPGVHLRAVTVHSDDHGRTWHAGQPVGQLMDENKLVELSDGTVMMNSRSSDGRVAARKIALSTDQGVTFGDVTVDSALIDPRNNASIIRAYPNAKKGSRCAKILLFSNAASTSSRQRGTIRVSYNDGKTWTTGKVFEPGAMSYSTLTPLDEPGKYGLLFEGTQSTIHYMPVSMEWLGEDPQCSTADATTQTDATETADVGTQTDSTETADMGTQTDSTETADTGTQTEGTETSDTGTQTEGTETSDTGTQTEGTETSDTGTQTEGKTPTVTTPLPPVIVIAPTTQGSCECKSGAAKPAKEGCEGKKKDPASDSKGSKDESSTAASRTPSATTGTSAPARSGKPALANTGAATGVSVALIGLLLAGAALAAPRLKRTP